MRYQATDVFTCCSKNDAKYIADIIKSDFGFTEDSAIKRHIDYWVPGNSMNYELAALLEREIRYVGSNTFACAARSMFNMLTGDEGAASGVDFLEVINDTYVEYGLTPPNTGNIKTLLKKLFLSAYEQNILSMDKDIVQNILRENGYNVAINRGISKIASITYELGAVYLDIIKNRSPNPQRVFKIMQTRGGYILNLATAAGCHGVKGGVIQHLYSNGHLIAQAGRIVLSKGANIQSMFGNAGKQIMRGGNAALAASIVAGLAGVAIAAYASGPDTRKTNTILPYLGYVLLREEDWANPEKYAPKTKKENNHTAMLSLIETVKHYVYKIIK